MQLAYTHIRVCMQRSTPACKPGRLLCRFRTTARTQKWQPFMLPSFEVAANARMQLLVPSATLAANAAPAAPAKARRDSRRQTLVTTGPLAKPGPAYEADAQPADDEDDRPDAVNDVVAGDVHASGGADGGDADAGWLGADAFGADDDGGDCGDDGGAVFEFDAPGGVDDAHAPSFDGAHPLNIVLYSRQTPPPCCRMQFHPATCMCK